MYSPIELKVARETGGRAVNMHRELEIRYAGLTFELGNTPLVRRLKDRPVTEEQIAAAKAAGNSVMLAIYDANDGLTERTAVIVRNFTNAGSRGIEAQVERVDKPGRYLTVPVADISEQLLAAAGRAGR